MSTTLRPENALEINARLESAEVLIARGQYAQAAAEIRQGLARAQELELAHQIASALEVFADVTEDYDHNDPCNYDLHSYCLAVHGAMAMNMGYLLARY